MRVTNTETFIQKANTIHNNQYDYSKCNYISAKTKVTIICPNHGPFKQSPSNHINRNSGCPVCSKSKQGVRYNTTSFIKRATLIHNSFYDYSTVKYESHNNPITIICPTHGPFKQKPTNHLQGYGCCECGKVSHTKSTYWFIKQATNIHNNQYDYSSVQYIRTDYPVEIECKIHGFFKQTPKQHLQGNGCVKCGYLRSAENTKLTNESFIRKAIELHGNRYDYSNVDYQSTKQKIQINCSKHGKFFQQPNMHLQGQNCPTCRGSISIVEQEWLTFMGIPNTIEHRQVLLNIHNKQIRVDGFMNNTVYEFLGDYWHGNPLLFESEQINPSTKIPYGELYQNTILRKQQIIDSGYQYKEMWERDWIIYKKQKKG